MPHKNIRTFGKLEEMGGNVAVAKAHYNIGAGELPSSKPAITSVVQYPDGRERNSTHTSEERDAIRAARIAIDVYNSRQIRAELKMGIPTPAEAAALSADDLRAIVLYALPAKAVLDEYACEFEQYPTEAWRAYAAAKKKVLATKMKETKRELPPSAHPFGIPASEAPTSGGSASSSGPVMPTGTDRSVGAGLDRIKAEFAIWRTSHLNAARAVAAKPAIIRIFPAGVIASTAEQLKNTETLLQEFESIGAYTLSESDSFILAVVDGRIEGAVLWTIEMREAERIARIPNLVVHPARQLRLDTGRSAVKNVGAKLVAEVERQAKIAGCLTLYLEAGTASVVPFYAKQGYKPTAPAISGAFHRQATFAAGTKAHEALAKAGATPGRQLMGKTLHDPEPPVVALLPIALTSIVTIGPAGAVKA